MVYTGGAKGRWIKIKIRIRIKTGRGRGWLSEREGKIRLAFWRRLVLNVLNHERLMADVNDANRKRLTVRL